MLQANACRSDIANLIEASHMIEALYRIRLKKNIKWWKTKKQFPTFLV